MKFLIKLPSRGRPELFKKNIIEWINFLSNENEYLFLFTFDEDDTTMNNDMIKNFVNSLPVNVEYHYSQCKNKVEAMNFGLENRDFDVIIPLIDDCEPRVKDFDKVIVELFDKNPDGLDAVINFHSVMWHSGLICFPVMGKTFFDRLKYIWHPGYVSLGCDNDLTYVVKLLDKEIFDMRTVFFHNFITGDETEMGNRIKGVGDFDFFYERKKRNFDLGETKIKIQDLNLPY